MQSQGHHINGGGMNSHIPQMRNPMQGNKVDEINPMNIFTNYLRRQQSNVPSGWQQTFPQQRRLTSMIQIFTVIMKSAGLQNEQARKDQWSTMVRTAMVVEDNAFKRSLNAMAYDEDVKAKMTGISNMAPAQQGGAVMRPSPAMQQPHSLSQQQRQNGTMLGTANLNPPQAQMVPTFETNDQRQMNVSQQDMFHMSQTLDSRLAQQGQQPRPNSQQVSVNPNKPTMSPEDQQYVVKITNHLIQQAQANSDSMQNLQLHISNMPPEERNRLGPNPLKAWFQRKAMNIFMQRKAQQAGIPQGAQVSGQMLQQSGQSINGNLKALLNQARTGNGTAAFDPAQFAGLQEQAMRSQASGDLVVPATNNQLAPGQQASFHLASNHAHQNFQQLNGHVRNPAIGQSMNQGLINEQAAAKARAQAHMSQSNLTPQRTPQQERLHGQGLHSSQPGQQPSPLALLNRPLQDQRLSTPQQDQARLNLPSDSAMQKTPLNGSAGQPSAQEQTRTQMNSNVLHLPPQLQNVYHNLPPQARAQMAGMDTVKLQQILTGFWHKQQQSMGNRFGPGSVPGTNVTNGSYMMSQGMGGHQPAKFDSVGNQGLQIPQGVSNIHAVQQNVGRSMPKMDPNALSLPREKINMHFPGLQIPLPIHNWGNFIQWIKESNAIPQERHQELNKIRQAQIYQLAEGPRTKNLQGLTAPSSSSTHDQPIEELLKNPVFLRTPQIDLDPSSISQRPVVRKGLVPLIGGLPQMPNPGPTDIAVARTATSMPDSEIVRHLRNRRLEQIRHIDPDMWRELRRSEHLRSLQATPRNQFSRQIQGNPANSQLQQPLGTDSGLRGMTQQDQNLRQAPAGRLYNPVKSVPMHVNGLENHDMSTKLNQSSNQYPVGVNNRQHVLDNSGRTSEQWPRLNPEQKQRDTGHMAHISKEAGTHDGVFPPRQGSRSYTTQQLLADFNRFSEETLQGLQITPTRQLEAAEGEQFRDEVKKNNLPHLFANYGSLAPLFFGKFRSNTKPNTSAMTMLTSVVRSAHLIRKQDFRNHQYNLTIDEFRKHIEQVQKFVNTMTTATQNGQQPPGSTLAQPPVVQDETIQVKSQSQSSSRRDSKSNVPPPAPTAKKAPYSFERHTSPHGTPRYGSNNTFDPNKIAIPRERQNKRKHGADSTKTTPILQQVKPQEPEKIRSMQKASQTPPPIQVLPFKCPIPRCEREMTGFCTQEEADKHAKDVHNFQGDEVEWCLDMLRGVLNLDGSGQPKIKRIDQDMKQAPAMHDALTTVSGTHTTPSAHSAVLPVESAAAAWKRQQAQRKGKSTLSIPSRKPPSNIGGLVNPAESKAAEQIDPAETWKNSNIQPGQLHYLFSGLEDFPQIGLDAFAGLEVDLPSFPSDAPGFTINSMQEKAKAQQEKSSKSPGEVLKIRLEDYAPFSELHGGVDPYAGRRIELIEDDEPFVPIDPDEHMKALLDPEKMKDMQRKDVEEVKRKAEDNWFDIRNPKIDDFLNMDGEVGSEQEDGTPPKRFKTSPEVA